MFAQLSWDWMGWMVNVIIGHRSSKRTFDANNKMTCGSLILNQNICFFASVVFRSERGFSSMPIFNRVTSLLFYFTVITSPTCTGCLDQSLVVVVVL